MKPYRGLEGDDDLEGLASADVAALSPQVMEDIVEGLESLEVLEDVGREESSGRSDRRESWPYLFIESVASSKLIDAYLLASVILLVKSD